MAIRRLALYAMLLTFVQAAGAAGVQAAEVGRSRDVATASFPGAPVAEPAPARGFPDTAPPPALPSANPGATAAEPPGFIDAPPPASARDVVVTAPAKTAIYLILSTFHTDLVIPRAAFERAPEPIRRAVAAAPKGDWIIVGWGPGWFGRDLHGSPFHRGPVRTISALWALLVPTHSHVRLTALAAPGVAPGDDFEPARPILVTTAGLDGMIRRINASLVVGPDGGPMRSGEVGVLPGVSLYRSKEIYQLAHECNQWAGEVLRAGGIKTSYLLDLVPGTLNLDLKLHGVDASPAPTVAATAPGG